MRTCSLLEVLQGILERTYRMDTGVRDIHRYVVGDRGLERLLAGREVVEVVGHAWGEAKVLVREERGAVFVNIYYPDRLIERLEGSNPLFGVDASNLDPFAVFVEELDHFLTIADRVRARRHVSLFELELHAGVTKYLVGRHFCERSCGRPLSRGERTWLAWSLFEKLEVKAGPPELRERYRMADRLARRYAGFLDRMPPLDRLRELRWFHRQPQAHLVRRIETISA